MNRFEFDEAIFDLTDEDFDRAVEELKSTEPTNEVVGKQEDL